MKLKSVGNANYVKTFTNDCMTWTFFWYASQKCTLEWHLNTVDNTESNKRRNERSHTPKCSKNSGWKSNVTFPHTLFHAFMDKKRVQRAFANVMRTFLFVPRQRIAMRTHSTAQQSAVILKGKRRSTKQSYFFPENFSLPLPVFFLLLKLHISQVRKMSKMLWNQQTKWTMSYQSYNHPKLFVFKTRKTISAEERDEKNAFESISLRKHVIKMNINEWSARIRLEFSVKCVCFFSVEKTKTK